MLKIRPVTTIVASLTGLLLGQAAAHATPNPMYQKLLDQNSPAMVTVKFVLKLQGGFGSRDLDREFTGLMIDPKGLVLCSGVRLGTSKLMKSSGATATPTDIKVLIGDDTEGLDATLVANDTDLDLSWIQIKKPGEKPLAYFDMTKNIEVKPGDDILTLSRMDKFYDRALIVSEGHVAGRVKKPRSLLVPTAGLDPEPGMPVFSHDGTPVGVVIVQSPDPEDVEGGVATGKSTVMLVLSAKEVVKATTRAREAAQESDDDDPTTSAPAVKDLSESTTKPAKDKSKADDSATKKTPAKE